MVRKKLKLMRETYPLARPRTSKMGPSRTVLVDHNLNTVGKQNKELLTYQIAYQFDPLGDKKSFRNHHARISPKIKKILRPKKSPFVQLYHPCSQNTAWKQSIGS